MTNPAAQHIHHILEPGEQQCIASGYTFTECPLWDPAGYFYFADVRDDTRWNKYIHELTLDASGNVTGRRIFADMTRNEAPGSPDGIKCDVEGRVYGTGPGGICVFGPDGLHLGIIEHPQPAVNFCFGGADLKTLFVCAHDWVYVRRMNVPGQAHPYGAQFQR